MQICRCCLPVGIWSVAPHWLYTFKHNLQGPVWCDFATLIMVFRPEPGVDAYWVLSASLYQTLLCWGLYLPRSLFLTVHEEPSFPDSPFLGKCYNGGHWSTLVQTSLSLFGSLSPVFGWKPCQSLRVIESLVLGAEQSYYSQWLSQDSHPLPNCGLNKRISIITSRIWDMACQEVLNIMIRFGTILKHLLESIHVVLDIR